MTSLFVDPADLWVVADLEVDPGRYALDLVRSRAEEADICLERTRETLITEVIVSSLESSRAEDPPPVMLLFLYPVPDHPIVTSVSIRAESLTESMTLDEFADDLRLPVEMLEASAVVEAIETRSGQALHMIQRYREPVSPGEEQILENETYAWVLEDYDGPMLVTLSTSYVDLVAAGRWRPELTALASSLVMQQDPDEP
jgi:hypothetical protein